MKTLALALAKHEELFRRSLLLGVLYFLAVAISLSKDAALDPDIWWHLRAGQWIYQHGAVPTTDPFSAYGQGKPWFAYSWLFELLVYGLFQAFGSVGLVIYTVALSLAIVSALLMLLRTIEEKPAIVIGLTALGIFAMGPLLRTPRPWLFSILFFIIEMNMLLRARRTGEYRRLALLPGLFALWANLHIQFIYGLFALGALLAESFIMRMFRCPFAISNVKAAFDARLWIITAACIIATLATPYHVHLYGAILDTLRQTGIYKYVSELQALSFRTLPDWAVLALTVMAAFMLGRGGERKAFPWLLFVAGLFVSFRSSRDVWFLIVTAATIIPSFRPAPSVSDRLAITRPQALIAATGVVMIACGMILKYEITVDGLNKATAGAYPAAAVDMVKERGYTGPLYNHFNWGGYLIWRLPKLLVSIDGRTNVQGDERIERSIKTWNGARDWAKDPELGGARLVIANVDMPLCSLLRFDKRFELVYEDGLAAVFTAKPVPSP